MGVKTNKQEYFEKLKSLLEENKSIFIVTVDNVSKRIPKTENNYANNYPIGLVSADARDP